MAIESTHDKLLRLLDLIFEERNYARNLEIEKLQQTVAEKEELLNHLAVIREITEEDKIIASKIRRENRRNAYLYKSALGWIRETMEFFGRRTVTSTYAADAGTVPAQVNGRLLSGKV